MCSEQWPQIYHYPTGHLEINVDKMLNVCLFLLFSRTNWIKAVQMCSKAREFALALAILECAIKPVAMLPVWKDSLGHTRYTQCASYTVYISAFPQTQINKITLVCSTYPHIQLKCNTFLSKKLEDSNKHSVHVWWV